MQWMGGECRWILSRWVTAQKYQSGGDRLRFAPSEKFDKAEQRQKLAHLVQTAAAVPADPA